MGEGQLDDLKQFITATASQTEERLLGEILQLRSEIADGFSDVGEAFEHVYDSLDELDAKINKGLAKLEH